MNPVVRAVDVGFGHTKFVTGVAGTEIRCTSFPSLCYPAARDSSKAAAIESRATMCIPIGGLFYEVGPDVVLAGDAFRPSQMHDRYTETPEYLALLRGALRMMKVSEIHLLVVGLPYRKRFGGDFAIGRTIPYVLKHAPCEVWVVREPIPAEPARSTVAAGGRKEAR